MMQESLTSKHNKLLSFRHEEVIIWNFEGVLQFQQRSVHLDSVQLHLLLQALVFRKVEALVPPSIIDRYTMYMSLVTAKQS